MMDIAKREKLRRIVFIHGVGKGYFATNLRSHQEQDHPDCTWRDADPRSTVPARPK